MGRRRRSLRTTTSLAILILTGMFLIGPVNSSGDQEQAVTVTNCIREVGEDPGVISGWGGRSPDVINGCTGAGGGCFDYQF